jgi:glyoxylase-like metal-dependent hydrolase (beta-lactamase superfamily II)
MYKIYAIEQGEREVEGHRPLPWPAKAPAMIRIAYYVWCIKSDKATIIVDTGLNDEEAHERKLNGVEYLKSRFGKLGIDLASVNTVIASHLHFDHFSAVELYPKATFYIQRKEMEFWAGPAAVYPQLAAVAPDMAEIMKLAYGGRVRFLDGDQQFAPGIRLVLMSGHTPGSQAVVVDTNMGQAVIAGDVIDLYRNLEEKIVGAPVDLLQALITLEKVSGLASSPELLLPGHEPLIMKNFPNPFEGIAEIG